MNAAEHPFVASLLTSTIPRVPLLDGLRKESLAGLTECALPTGKHEEWRFSELRDVVSTQRKVVVTGSLSDADRQRLSIPESGAAVLSTVNGLPSVKGFVCAGVEAGTPANLSEAALGAVKDALNTGASYWADAFKLLNDVTAPELLCLVIPPDSSVELPVHLLHVGDTEGVATAISNRTVVVVGRNSKVTFVEDYRSVSEDETYFRNAMTEVVVGENAHVTHIRVQDESPKAQHLLRSAVRLQANSHYDSYTISVGASWARHDLLARHEGEGAFARIDGLALLVDEQVSDTHSVIDNTRPHCNSHQLHKTIVGGKAQSIFNGKILVQKGAQKIDAYQLNRGLLLSPTAKIHAKPQLEILADDVRCTHGATIGQLDEDQLFYLRTRGFDAEGARGLLTYAFAGEVLESLTIPSLRDQLSKLARIRTM